VLEIGLASYMNPGSEGVNILRGSMTFLIENGFALSLVGPSSQSSKCIPMPTEFDSGDYQNNPPVHGVHGPVTLNLSTVRQLSVDEQAFLHESIVLKVPFLRFNKGRRWSNCHTNREWAEPAAPRTNRRPAPLIAFQCVLGRM